jgi:hypothetical protein
VKPSWVLDDAGKAHLRRFWTPAMGCVTWCESVIDHPKPVKEPKADEPWCRRCTDREAAAA